jgi:hypothetical protein
MSQNCESSIIDHRIDSPFQTNIKARVCLGVEAHQVTTNTFGITTVKILKNVSQYAPLIY